MQVDSSNTNFQLASDYINFTNQSVFLTGKAGTGKTTFLKYIKEHTQKNMAVVAPTGVAAINAGGVTIHSFFQLPFHPFIPEGSANLFNNIHAIDRHHLLGTIRVTAERKKIFQQLELLVIDEMSMVRADVLDEIDVVLRHFRNRYSEPFGGVQLLLIGDMFQLPPVVRQEEWTVLSRYYDSSFFFSSNVMKSFDLVCIELDKIYRQNDDKFIHLLNKVRNDDMNEFDFAELHQRYIPGFQMPENSGHIILTTHNNKADVINTRELEKLKGEVFSFTAEIRDEFSESSYPADEILYLKKGAQVMFIKNDLDKAKRYFNGKIGIVENIMDDKITVRCKGEAEAIEVQKYVWENVRYKLNGQTQKVEEENIGSFSQYPLRLAWAITIHKSQGLTFENAVIDAGQAFAAGQVYVALSRCTNLQGIVLLSKIDKRSLQPDHRVQHFNSKQRFAQSSSDLQLAKKQYQQKLLAELFSFANLIKQFEQVARVVNENNHHFNTEANEYMAVMEEKLMALENISVKFQMQISHLQAEDGVIENNKLLQERIAKASEYFSLELEKLIAMIKNSPVVTESKQSAFAFDEELTLLFEQLSLRVHIIQSFVSGFAIDKYFSAKNSFKLPYFGVRSYALKNQHQGNSSPHPELYKQLKQVRDTIAETKQLPIYMVANADTLDEMSRYLPQNTIEIKEIKGFGKAKAEKYGFQFLDIIHRYCNEHELSSLMHEKQGKKRERSSGTAKDKFPKIDTKKVTLEMYQAGSSIAEIAATRNLAQQTIEGHLSHYVALGELDALLLITKEKLDAMDVALKDVSLEQTLTAIREQAGDQFTFGELRLFLSYKKSKQSQV